MTSRSLRILLLACVAAALLLAAGCSSGGTPTASPNTPSSGGLVENPKQYDDTEVTFKGEAIGEAMKRGSYTWLHVNDDPYYLKNVEEGAKLGGYNSGIPVWIPTGEAERVRYFGDYKHEGDIIEVVGVFHSACPEHGGDTDIHATSLKVVQVGHTVVDPVRAPKVLWAAILSVIAAGLFLLTRTQGHLRRARA